MLTRCLVVIMFLALSSSRAFGFDLSEVMSSVRAHEMYKALPEEMSSVVKNIVNHKLSEKGAAQRRTVIFAGHLLIEDIVADQGLVYKEANQDFWHRIYDEIYLMVEKTNVDSSVEKLYFDLSCRSLKNKGQLQKIGIKNFEKMYEGSKAYGLMSFKSHGRTFSYEGPLSNWVLACLSRTGWLPDPVFVGSSLYGCIVTDDTQFPCTVSEWEKASIEALLTEIQLARGMKYYYPLEVKRCVKGALQELDIMKCWKNPSKQAEHQEIGNFLMCENIPASIPLMHMFVSKTSFSGALRAYKNKFSLSSLKSLDSLLEGVVCLTGPLYVQKFESLKARDRFSRMKAFYKIRADKVSLEYVVYVLRAILGVLTADDWRKQVFENRLKGFSVSEKEGCFANNLEFLQKLNFSELKKNLGLPNVLWLISAAGDLLCQKNVECGGRTLSWSPECSGELRSQIQGFFVVHRSPEFARTLGHLNQICVERRQILECEDKSAQTCLSWLQDELIKTPQLQ